MINPHTSGVLDGDTVVIKDSSKLQVANNNVGGVNDGDSVATDGSSGGSSPNGLVRANTETSWEIKSTLNDDVTSSITLHRISFRSRWIKNQYSQ